jgi:hypothetical protein
MLVDVQACVDDLLSQRKSLKYRATSLAYLLSDIPEMRDKAEIIKRFPYAPVVFRMIRGQLWSDTLWKLVKPKETIQLGKYIRTEEEETC